ncbi:hypothetical protein CMO89_03315 [Candidatus Woesearchaeota archaeon]|nr:hypothetical protein [Candidatus Woesearchaeota archaeon]|tara:strand:+ start:448 stop:1023 length:576 start_codon:yes stop_codon:yes gene_type:complete
MLELVKKIAVIIVIATLYGFFSFSIVDMVIEEPDYEDFCPMKPAPVRRTISEEQECPSFIEPTEADFEDCNEREGDIQYLRDEFGCRESFECNTCRGVYEEAGKEHRLYGFIITSILGVLAIIISLYIKSKTDVVEWVFSGFLIGGIVSIFIGTISYFHDMGRFIKPFILLAEIALIIFIAVKTAMKQKKP